MENVNIVGYFQVGGLVAHAAGGSIDNCYVTGSVTSFTTPSAGWWSDHRQRRQLLQPCRCDRGESCRGADRIRLLCHRNGHQQLQRQRCDGHRSQRGGLIGHNADTSHTNVTSSYWDTTVSLATSAPRYREDHRRDADPGDVCRLGLREHVGAQRGPVPEDRRPRGGDGAPRGPGDAGGRHDDLRHDPGRCDGRRHRCRGRKYRHGAHNRHGDGRLAGGTGWRRRFM